jgi:hypothetical protein
VDSCCLKNNLFYLLMDGSNLLDLMIVVSIIYICSNLFVCVLADVV